MTDLQQIADYFADAKLYECEQTILLTICQLKSLEENRDWYRDRVVWGFYEEDSPKYYQGPEGENEICSPVSAKEVENLIKALDVYGRERQRFQHTYPEITGQFFLTGGHGEKDDNMLPQFVTICPAYGAAWEQVYERTEKTITYEGS
jgi:hypothetical protein